MYQKNWTQKNQQQEVTVADTSEQSSEETLLSAEDTSPNEHIEFSLTNTENTAITGYMPLEDTWKESNQ